MKSGGWESFRNKKAIDEYGIAFLSRFKEDLLQDDLAGSRIALPQFQKSLQR